jgi:hypothetical protein
MRAIEHGASDSPRPLNEGYKAGTRDLYPLKNTIGDKFLSHLTIRAVILAPGQKLRHSLRVGAAGVAVADVGREEFDEARRPGDGARARG